MPDIDFLGSQPSVDEGQRIAVNYKRAVFEHIVHVHADDGQRLDVRDISEGALQLLRGRRGGDDQGPVPIVQRLRFYEILREGEGIGAMILEGSCVKK